MKLNTKSNTNKSSKKSATNSFDLIMFHHNRFVFCLDGLMSVSLSTISIHLWMDCPELAQDKFKNFIHKLFGQSHSRLIYAVPAYKKRVLNIHINKQIKNNITAFSNSKLYVSIGLSKIVKKLYTKIEKSVPQNSLFQVLEVSSIYHDWGMNNYLTVSNYRKGAVK